MIGAGRAMLALGAAALLWAGCSDNPAGDDQATVQMQSGLTSSMVTPGAGKLAGGSEADSLRITRVRILISRMKLHRDKEDTVSGDRDVKVGPFLLTIDASGAKVFTTAAVPAGTYDKVKFAFHRFSSSEIGTYLNDSAFGAFVTGERYSFLVDGQVYVNGAPVDFTYRSDATANLTLPLDVPAQLDAGGGATLLLQLDPRIAFKDGTLVLDPRDPRNQSKIDNNIVRAIKALKK